MQRNYDPPPPPSNHSNHSTPQSSPQQGSSNQNQPLTQSQFQMATPPQQAQSQFQIQTSTQQSTQPTQYIPAQSSISQNTNPILTINTLHTNPGTNLTTSRTLSTPPLPLIQNNPLAYNLNSTNFHQQPSSTLTQNHSTHQSLPPQVHNHLSFPTTQPNPYIQTVPTQSQPTTFNILPISQNSHTTHIIPPSTLPPLTHTTPTYINSSTSISEPNKPFDGLDHNYTPEEYLQHIEARVTFSLGLQPTNAHEYKFWHARRMAFIQCSLTGTALSWYIRLNDTYKQDWHAFIQAFKKQFSSQKNDYYAQVEALSLVKKDNETVRHFALKVQQLVEKGWCNENASTINLKCNEIITKGLPKNLKDFANKRQVKHTSTVLEPSIPFHTLVKLVDAEDIANDKIRTHDLTLEVNNITKQLQTNTLDSQQSDQRMFTQPRDPNNKTKPAYKKYCSYCHRTNHSISACFKKQRDDEDRRDAYSRSKSPQKSFVQYFRSSSNDKPRYNTQSKDYSYRNRSRSTSRNNSYRNNNSQYRQRSTSKTRYDYDKSTTPSQYTTSRYDNYRRDSRSHRSPYRSSYRSPYRRDSRPRSKSRSYSRDNTFQRYNSSYRPPSKPRDSRYSRSRSHSDTRNKINIIQQQPSSDPIKFEIHMYHPTEMANALTPTSWFYTLYTHSSPSQNQRDYPSRLEISFLLDSGASISVLNYPTYITISKLLSIKQNTSHHSSKTLTVANQTEVPILHYITITLNTTIEDDSRQFIIPFAVADIKYNILGTPFFEENIQNINIQDFTLQFKHHSKIYPNHTTFTSLLSIDYPYFSYIYRNNSKTQIRLKPNSSKIAHFPINNYYILHFSTTPQNRFFPTIPHTYFSSKFCTTFNFIEVFTDDKPDNCATIIQNSTDHVATLPTGHIGYIEVPITNEKHKYYQDNDINTLIHNVAHTYHPEITEPIPQTNYSLSSNVDTFSTKQFSLHQIYMISPLMRLSSKSPSRDCCNFLHVAGLRACYFSVEARKFYKQSSPNLKSFNCKFTAIQMGKNPDQIKTRPRRYHTLVSQILL